MAKLDGMSLPLLNQRQVNSSLKQVRSRMVPPWLQADCSFTHCSNIAGKVNANWQEKILAFLLLAVMLLVIFRVVRDFSRQGLSVSQGAAQDMETITEMDEDEDIDGAQID